MRYLLIPILLCSGLVAQTAPTFLQVGTLSCAARMWTPTQLQVWCLAGTKIQINILDDMSDGTEFSLLTCDEDPSIGTCIIWNFAADITVEPIKVNWRAKITKAGVDSSLLTGVL